MKKLIIASCKDLPDWEVDDAPFHGELEKLGVSYQLSLGMNAFMPLATNGLKLGHWTSSTLRINPIAQGQ